MSSILMNWALTLLCFVGLIWVAFVIADGRTKEETLQIDWEKVESIEDKVSVIEKKAKNTLRRVERIRKWMLREIDSEIRRTIASNHRLGQAENLGWPVSGITVEGIYWGTLERDWVDRLELVVSESGMVHLYIGGENKVIADFAASSMRPMDQWGQGRASVHRNGKIEIVFKPDADMLIPLIRVRMQMMENELANLDNSEQAEAIVLEMAWLEYWVAEIQGQPGAKTLNQQLQSLSERVLQMRR